MKSKLLMLFFVGFFLLTFGKSNALAQESENNEYYEYNLVPYTKVADKINIINKVESDVILIGSNISINSEIDGDAFIVGEYIEVNAKINGSLRFISSSEVVLRSYVDGSVSGISPTLTLTSTADINRDVYGYFDKFNNQGRIGKDLNISLNGEARGTNNGKVIGNAFYTNLKPILGDRSFIQGGLFNIPDTQQVEENPQLEIIFNKLFHAASIMMIFLAIKIFRKDLFSKLSKRLNTISMKTIIVGLITLISSFIIIPLLIISLVGFPLAIILTGIMFTIWYVSPIVGSLYIGNKIFSNKADSIVRFVVSLLLFDLITIAPIIGSLISILVFVLTIGIVYEYIVPKKVTHE